MINAKILGNFRMWIVSHVQYINLKNICFYQFYQLPLITSHQNFLTCFVQLAISTNNSQETTLFLFRVHSLIVVHTRLYKHILSQEKIYVKISSKLSKLQNLTFTFHHAVHDNQGLFGIILNRPQNVTTCRPVPCIHISINRIAK